jgi:DNA-binding transcriptional ArsR family regulator
MNYEVKIDFCEAYELFSSFNAYTNKKSHKVLELGGSWVKNVREKLHPKFGEELKKLKSLDVWFDLLLLDCPANKRSTVDFLYWMDALSVGELYESMSRWVPEGSEAFHDLEDWRNRMVHLFSLWNEDYFQHMDLSILTDLKKDAQEKQQLVEKYSPIDVVEEVTNGLRIESMEGLKKVILVPQYHFRPLNLISKYRGLHIYYYPADTQSVEVDTPSHSLMRLTKSLADENRLRILRFLIAGDKSFTEIVQFIGLAKSTVHYHMVSLRSSGLVRVRLSTESGERYSLRQGALDKLRDHLAEYLGH